MKYRVIDGRWGSIMPQTEFTGLSEAIAAANKCFGRVVESATWKTVYRFTNVQ